MSIDWITDLELWDFAETVCSVSAGDIKRISNPLVFRVWPPRPQVALNSVHNNSNYVEHPYFQAKSKRSHYLNHAEASAIINKACIGLENMQGLRLLDIGCGTGMLMQIARDQYGFLVEGLDVSEQAISAVRSMGMAGHCVDLSLFEDPTGYDLIIMNDLVEHVADPGLVLAATKNLLRPKGRLYITTPNAEALLYTALAPLGEHLGLNFLTEKLFPLFHEWCFSLSALRELVEHHGLRVITQETYEFPLSNFGHGFVTKMAFAILTLVQKASGNFSLQCLVAQNSENE